MADSTSPPNGESSKIENASRPTKALPTDRAGFDRQMDILRAYGATAAENGMTAAGIAELVGMHSSTVSVCNPFFSENGLIERVPDGGYRAAPETVAFQLSHQWNPEKAGEKLAPRLRMAWFWATLEPRLSFRPMEETEVVQALAEKCNASPSHRGQVSTIIEYLAAAKLVLKDGTMIRKGPLAATMSRGNEEEPKMTPPQGEQKREPVTPPPATGLTPGISFDVSIRVDMREMAGWSKDRIEAFFQGIAAVLAAKGQVSSTEP